MDKETIPDQALVTDCQKGNISSFELLMERYEKKVFNTVLRLIGDYEEAIDITKQAFINAFISINRLKKEKNFQAWIYRIALNLAKNKLKKKEKRIKFVSIEEPFGEEEKERTIQDYKDLPADKIMMKKEIQDKVQSAISSLSASFRIVIVLREIDGLSYEEISKITKVSVGTVKSRIFRAREILKERLKPYIEEEDKNGK